MEKLSLNIKELLIRTISVAVMVPIVLLFVYLKGVFFIALIVIAAILMSYEWQSITAIAKTQNLWQILGVIYITVPSIALFKIIHLEQGEKIIYFLFAVVWSSDIGGYLFGKMIGGIKLAPSISPNKTWAGFIGGILLAVIAGKYFEILSIYQIIILSVVTQAGDLLESMIKRRFNVKDSGNLIPGHGGVLDAVDGLVTSAPVLLLMLSL